MKPIVIFGAQLIAELAHFYFENDSEHQVAAFCVDSTYRQSDTVFGKPLVDFETVEQHYPPAEYDFFVAVSYQKLNQTRTDKVAEAKAKGYSLVSYVSSKATTFSDFNHGENCFILEDNTIQPFVKIGHNVTLWSGNHIGHHSTIEDNVFISSKVVVSGNCVIKRNCFIGVGSCLRDNIVIGEYNLIGAACYIGKSTESDGFYRTRSTERANLKSSELKGI